YAHDWPHPGDTHCTDAALCSRIASLARKTAYGNAAPPRHFRTFFASTPPRHTRYGWSFRVRVRCGLLGAATDAHTHCACFAATFRTAQEPQASAGRSEGAQHATERGKSAVQRGGS